MVKELHCSRCRQNRPIELFNIEKRSKRGYKSKCKDCCNTYKREYRRKNPEKFKEYYLKERNQAASDNYEKYRDSYYKYCYGISVEEYNKLAEKQNNKCAICLNGEYIVDNRTKNIRRLSVDHDHKTGKVRGLLCKNCNTGLGMLREDLNIVNNLIKYLERNDV